ncbi:hypothetical protein GCM10010921_13710 [Microbacterium album]|uniref:SIR2-like domain-containing protein n=1 Tax=Microbacterium album TaxID=2053191 RepID=A0A917IFK1_9MICO|nr:hypothetical protein GCM10010921_13710 [Microbacterium album]
MDAEVVPDANLANKLLKHNDPHILLEAARDGAADWEQALTRALYPPESFPTPSALHISAAGHYLADPKRTTLATLNYDVLLEHALVSGMPDDTSGVAIVTGENAPRSDDPQVFHLHGVITDSLVRDAIVSFDDYARLVAEPSPWQRGFLEDALSRGALTLMGTSYRDPDIRQWLHTLCGSGSSPHPAIVLVVRESLGLSHEEFLHAEATLRRVWESIGLTALTTHSFVDAAQILRELSFLDSADYASPDERVGRAWSEHARRFAALQREYSDALAGDRDTMRVTLGTGVPQATLWLARPGGRLARWASHDRYYRSPRELLHAPTGHDSSWLAGKALGTERQVLDDISPKAPARDARRRSVLAIPLILGDGVHPEFAGAVLTFGLERPAEHYARDQSRWAGVADKLAKDWGRRLSANAFDRIRE